MCRTRQQIIDTDPTLQDLCLFIKQFEEKLSAGKNGKIHFELAQARASLDTRIAQIQDSENTMEKFDEADNKREKIKTVLKEQLETCETNLTKLDTKLDKHLIDHTKFPPLKQAIADKPFKTLGWLFGIIISTYTFLFFASHVLLYGTGFDVMLEKFIEGLFGL